MADNRPATISMGQDTQRRIACNNLIHGASIRSGHEG
jgi:hypothetical protein